jgi:hypothetical protein
MELGNVVWRARPWLVRLDIVARCVIFLLAYVLDLTWFLDKYD